MKSLLLILKSVRGFVRWPGKLWMKSVKESIYRVTKKVNGGELSKEENYEKRIQFIS